MAVSDNVAKIKKTVDVLQVGYFFTLRRLIVVKMSKKIILEHLSSVRVVEIRKHGDQNDYVAI